VFSPWKSLLHMLSHLEEYFQLRHISMDVGALLSALQRALETIFGSPNRLRMTRIPYSVQPADHVRYIFPAAGDMSAADQD